MEALAESGEPLPRYTQEECLPISQDRVEQAVTWKNRRDVRELAGRPVRLRFTLWNAQLYSYQVS